jgi:PAS domain S-box-containing protein
MKLANTDARTPKSWRIVIIDDSADDRAEIRRMLLVGSLRRYEFGEASTGALGLDLLRNELDSPPDCVILDYRLPDIEAAELLAALDRDDDSIACPVVVLTGCQNHDLSCEMLRAGAQDFVGKSWMTPESLTRAVENARERWSMSRELREGERRFRLAARLTGLAVAEIDYVTDNVRLSADAAAIFGLAARASVIPRADVHAMFHPDDRAVAEERISKALDPDGSGEFALDLRIRPPGGGVRWLGVRKQVFFNGGRPLRAFMAIFDITDRKRAEEELFRAHTELEDRTAQLEAANHALRQSEERYRNVVDDQTELVCRRKPDGTLTFVNDRFCRFFGTTREKISGHPWGLVVRDQSTEPNEVDLAQLTPESPLIVVASRFRDERGQMRWLEFINRGLFAPDGSLVEIQSVGRDITERKETEERLVKAMDDAQAAALAKGNFLANMSHEIRTPMNGVIGMAELLKDTRLDSLQRDYVETIRSSGAALLTVINDILDLSKIEADKLTLDETSFDPRTVMEEVAELLSPTAQQKGLRLSCRIDPRVPPRVVGDPARIRQILTNLAGNAVKFTERGEIHLEARTPPESNDVGRLHFSITDTGIGIEAAHHERIFDSFTQVDGGSTRTHGGTGLGLTICRRLVGLMHGTIGVESALGRGSTFWFEIALKAGEGASDVRPPTCLLGRRILICDDNGTDRQVAHELLTSWGARPDAVATCLDAIDRLFTCPDDDPYSLALFSLDSKYMNWRQITRAIKVAPRFQGLPLVAVLNHDQPATAGEYDHGLFAAVIAKPIRRLRLRDAVCIALSQRGVPGDDRPVDTTLSAPVPVVLNILLAEDNDVSRIVAAQMLERLGCRVDWVVDGKRAVEASAKKGYDLILMDVQMPVMDGYAATAAIRTMETKTGRRTPIVALTAHAMPGDRLRCLAAGMDDYLPKPLQPGTLREALMRWGIGMAQDAREPGLESNTTQVPVVVE